MAGHWKNIDDEKEKYAAYLCSREWAEKREAVRNRADDKCERCKILPMAACHHLTYLRKYNEDLDDLQAICQACHDFTHGKTRFDPIRCREIFTYLSLVKSCSQEPEKVRPYPADMIWAGENSASDRIRAAVLLFDVLKDFFIYSAFTWDPCFLDLDACLEEIAGFNILERRRRIRFEAMFDPNEYVWCCELMGMDGRLHLDERTTDTD